MATRSSRMSVLVAAAGTALFAAGSAQAQSGFPYGPEVFRIESTTMIDGSPVTRTVSFTTNDGGTWDGYDHYNWAMQGGPLVVRANPLDALSPILYTLTSATIEIDADPFVTSSFNITAGALNSTFTVSSSPLSLPAGSYTGQTSGNVTVTDLDGDGATLSVINSAGLFRASYNGPTVFADLFPANVVAAPFSSNSGVDSYGFVPIVPVITDITAAFTFGLTANDSATGSGQFTVIPGPGALALLGLGGMVAARRRRS